MKENQIVNYNFGHISQIPEEFSEKMHQKLLVSATDSCNSAELYMSLNFRGGNRTIPDI